MSTHDRVGPACSAWLLCAILTGCGGEGDGARSNLATSPSPHVVLSGRVDATNNGAPLSSVAVEIASQTTMRDESGSFRVEWSFIPGASRMTLTSEATVPRVLNVNVASSRQITVDAIAQGVGFDLDFYRSFVRNAFSEPANLQPLRRWTRAPMVYLKTVDEAGEPIDATTLDTVTSSATSIPTRIR